MFKKLAALICAGMLFFAGFGTSFAKSEDVPLGQKILYKYGMVEDKGMWIHTVSTATPNLFALFFLGIWYSQELLDEYILVTYATVHGGYKILIVPESDGSYIGYVEFINDGDQLVDAVIKIRSDGTVIILRDSTAGDEIPSIYSAIYMKHMSKLSAKYGMELVKDVDIACLGELDGTEM